MNRILSAFAIAIITVVVFVTAAWASDCIHNDATTGTCQSWNAHCTCSQSGEDNCDGTSRTIYRGTGGLSTCIGGWQGSSSTHYKMVAAGGNCGHQPIRARLPACGTAHLAVSVSAAPRSRM